MYSAISGMKGGNFKSSTKSHSPSFNPIFNNHSRFLTKFQPKTTHFHQTLQNNQSFEQKRNFSFEIINLTSNIAYPLIYGVTSLSCLLLFKRTILASSKLTPTKWLEVIKRRMANEDPREFTKDIEVSNIHTPGRVRMGSFKTGFNFPTKATTKLHLYELGFPEKEIDEELEPYNNEEQVDVSTIIQKLIDRDALSVYPNPDRNLYYIIQHHTFIVQSEASKEMLKDSITEDEKVKGIVSCLHLTARPSCVPNFKKILQSILFTSLTLPPLTACILYSLFSTFISPITYVNHPILVAIAGTLLITPFPQLVALLQDAYFNYSEQKMFLDRKLDLCALLPHNNPEKFYRKKFSFIAEAGTLLQKNGLKITKAKDGHHDFLNGFATFFTNKEISIPNVQMWRVILSEKKERTFSFFILYFIVLLIIGYVLGNNYQIEDESFPYYQYFDDDNNKETVNNSSDNSNVVEETHTEQSIVTEKIDKEN